MEIISSNDTKKVKNPEDVFIEFVLDAQNLLRIPINILYFKEHGFRKFVVTYDFEKLKIPMSKVTEKICESLLKIINTQDVIIAFKGFPACIFNKNILRPGLRYKYEKKILFLSKDLSDSNILPEKCKNCMNRESCAGIEEKYLKNFKDDEISPMISNSSLYDVNLNHIEKFQNEEVKNISLKILDDFKEDKSYLRKRIVYVKSFPDDLSESSKERIVYYIYNHYSDFEKTYSFMISFFEKQIELIEPFKVFIEQADQFALSFARMGDLDVRKSFYFSLSDLNHESIETLSEMVGIEIKCPVTGIGFDFKNDEISYKVYYDQDSINSTKIKEFISDVSYDKKKQLTKFLNSLTKPLNQVFLDYKYKNLSVYSKRVDVSLQYNNFRLIPLSILLGLELRFFDDKQMYTLSFEVSEHSNEKINFYYGLKLPEEVPYWEVVNSEKYGDKK